MKIPLAWLNLWHQKAKTAVAIAGVAFAVVLVLLQLGFSGSVRQTATTIYDRLRFDLVIHSPRYVQLSQAGEVHRQRLYQAVSTPGVAKVSPLYLGFALYRNESSPQRRGIFVLGTHLDDDVLDVAELSRYRNALSVAGNALMDRRSRPEFGPREPGTQARAGLSQITLVGTFEMGTGFGADGALLASDQSFVRMVPGRTLDDVSLGLVTLLPDQEAAAVAERLRAALPRDVRVLTRKEMEDHERLHWVSKTSVGIIFGLGVIVAVVVGTAIVYQVLSSDIASRLPEFATLKAMGYTPWFMSLAVLRQAWILAVAGFVPGLVLASALYALTARMAHLPMELPMTRVAAVFLISVVMCSLSGLAALRKVHSVDPADLFR